MIYLIALLGAFISDQVFASITLKPFSSGHSKPVQIVFLADNTHWVAEQGGKITSIGNKSRTVILDLDKRLETGPNESGLLGLILSPTFKRDLKAYVYYTAPKPFRARISEFTFKNNSLSSEKILLEINQPFGNHNGGALAFGKDGLLYIGVGDGGSGGDPLSNGQNPSKLLGKILRIHPNGAIPKSNPFYSKKGYRAEIYALGLRNPWRISFDAKNQLWVADVGQNSIEEINIVTSGKNYGWNVFEGKSCFKKNRKCKSNTYVNPVHSYSHNLGYSITGGYVYEGTRVKNLAGRYIYGDFGSGKIWGLEQTATGVSSSLLLNSDLNISSFGQDRLGEVYVVDHRSGKIYTISQ